LRIYDTLKIENLLKESPIFDNSSCNLSDVLNSDRVKIGGSVLNSSGESECKVRVINDGSFEFLTKTTSNIHKKVQGSPAWSQFKFLIPEGYVADKFSYEVSWYRLFGSYPNACDDGEKNATGVCEYKVDENWQDDIDAGVFILWATKTDTHYSILKSDEIAQKLGYSATKRITIDVPKEYRDKQDLSVTLFIYNQYSGGCDIDDLSQCKRASYRNLSLKSVSLESYKPFEKNKIPSALHPRVLGDNQEWLTYMKPLDEMGCFSTNNNKDTDWGGVTNVKNLWDRYSKGGALCDNSSLLKPSSLYNQRDAQFYLNHSTDKWSKNRALRVMHLLRREQYCHGQNQNNCLYPKSEIAQLENDFIDYEIDRFPNITWEGHGICFSIETTPPIKFWSLFLDTFWNDLTPLQKEPIQNKMSQKVECYLSQIAQKHWSFANGNNWNAILGKGAMYWAIANYYEDNRSQEVIQKTLEIMELHRDFYMEDGAYKEGIVEYTNVSYSNIREINNLLMQGFNRPLRAMDWENIQKTSDWFLNFMSPDGSMVDFGDSWQKRGWGTLDPLYMLLWEEMTGVKKIGEARLDSCKVKEYFNNVYYDHAFYDPWSVQPSIARDWQSVANLCNQTESSYIKFHLFPKGGMGAIRVNNPNSTALAKDNSNDRYKQANQTYLSVSAVPNEFPHREMDFGGLIWSAYGNRLLYDFGYGEIGKRYYDLYKIIDSHGVNHIDDLPLGANTLVIPEALYNGDPNTNISQILNKKGTITKETISGRDSLHLDGSLVYGKDDDANGWLDYFHRWLIPFDNGNFVIVDSFRVKENRPDANVTEYWYSKENSNYDISQGCKYQDEYVQMSLSDNHTLLLKPRCSMLKQDTPAEVVGKITALSLAGGAFIKDGEPISMINRLNKDVKRDRVRFVPNTPVREDIRIFLLSASTDESNLTHENIQKVDCGENRCFEVNSLNQTLSIELEKMDNEYRVIKGIFSN
jgi:hypothetical protein